MAVQPQLVLLQKTLLNVEGLGRQLYPDLDLWSTAKPFMERWMRERYGAKAFLNALVANAPTLLAELPRLPETLASAAYKLGDLERLARLQRQAVERLAATVDTQNRQVRRRRIVGTVLILAGVALMWRPLADAVAASGDPVSVAAAVAATLLGSLLVVRG